MIYFYEELVALAKNIINAKGTYDDVKASNDINNINYMLHTANPTPAFMNGAKQLDEKINKDYPEINEMHQIAANMKSNVQTNKNSRISATEYDVILENLKSDIFGIYASVLLKHGNTSCINDFIKEVD